MPWPIEDLEFARPALAWALLLPLLLLVTARYASRPFERATGALALWRQVVSEETPKGSRRRPRIPLSLWLAAAALACGGLALAGPQVRAATPPVTWTVVVDHSPSTGLPWLDSAGEPAGGSRLERAVDAACTWLRSSARSDDRVRWTSRVRTTLELGPDERPGADWLEAPSWSADAPRFALHDEPFTLWVTDQNLSLAPRRAGLFASGGAPVPGPVGTVGRERISWTGSELVRDGTRTDTRDVAVIGLPSELERMVRAWAQARGLGVVLTAGDASALLVVAGGDGDPFDVEGGRDGWTATGAARAGLRQANDPRAFETWLVGWDAQGRDIELVHAAPGVVRVGWTELDAPAGDPAAFAVSWSELFDRSMLPVPGVVPLAERAGAGEALEQAPRGRAASAGSAGDVSGAVAQADVEAWLSLAAAVLALAALATGASGSAAARALG